MSNKHIKTSIVSSVLGLGIILGGCALDSTSVLDILEDYGITEDMTIADALNQITIGDVVSAYVDFADEIATDSASALGLTDEDVEEIEALQAQLDAGEITSEEFTDAVHEIIGNRAPGIPFAGLDCFGGPFGHRMGRSAADLLDLTDEQQAAAEEIFAAAHEDIDTLREAAQEEIRALLTEEQLAILDEMGAYTDAGETYLMRRNGHGHGGQRLGGHGGFGPQDFADELDLTDEQQEAIDAIREELHDAIQARHEEAYEAFLALLTDEQLAILGIETETDPNTVDPNTVDPNTVDPNTVDPNSVDPNAIDPNSVDPNVVVASEAVTTSPTSSVRNNRSTGNGRNNRRR